MPEAELSGITQRRVGTNGIELNIAEQGEGPLVLMLHGFPESWYSWRHQIPAVAGAGFHAVAPDMRGYGRSTPVARDFPWTIDVVIDDFIGLMDALGLETAHWVGISTGGMILGRPLRLRMLSGMNTVMDAGAWLMRPCPVGEAPACRG